MAVVAFSRGFPLNYGSYDRLCVIGACLLRICGCDHNRACCALLALSPLLILYSLLLGSIVSKESLCLLAARIYVGSVFFIGIFGEYGCFLGLYLDRSCNDCCGVGRLALALLTSCLLCSVIGKESLCLLTTEISSGNVLFIGIFYGCGSFLRLYVDGSCCCAGSLTLRLLASCLLCGVIGKESLCLLTAEINGGNVLFIGIFCGCGSFLRLYVNGSCLHLYVDGSCHYCVIGSLTLRLLASCLLCSVVGKESLCLLTAAIVSVVCRALNGLCHFTGGNGGFFNCFGIVINGHLVMLRHVIGGLGLLALGRAVLLLRLPFFILSEDLIVLGGSDRWLSSTYDGYFLYCSRFCCGRFCTAYGVGRCDLTRCGRNTFSFFRLYIRIISPDCLGYVCRCGFCHYERHSYRVDAEFFIVLEIIVLKYFYLVGKYGQLSLLRLSAGISLGR